MPNNFATKDRTPQRFPADFQIDPVAPYEPNAEEAAFLGKLGAMLDALATAIADEQAEKLRDTLRAARRDWRLSTVSKLRDTADKFASGQNDVKVATEQLVKTEAEALATRPDVTIESLKDDTARFQGEFKVTAVHYTLDAAEAAFLKRLQDMLNYLAKEEADDRNAKLSDVMLAAHRQLRVTATEKLKTNARWWKEGTDSQGLANNVLLIRGNYEALRDRLGHSLFSIKEVHGDGEEKKYVVDLSIELEEGLPAPNDVASPEKQELFVQVANASTVVRKVCQQIRERVTRPEDMDAANKRARLLLDEYMKKLAGIGRLGLEGPHTALAKLALTNLKSDFVAHEAGRIKNRYLRRLGEWTGVFVAAFLIVYIVVKLNVCSGAGPATHARADICAAASWVWWDAHKMFLLAGAGAAAGTWVSFAIRRLDLPFEELTMLEEESLDPPFRILFVTALTLIVCLLFWNSAINIEIGNLKTGPDFFKNNGTIAILIGMFCGLSERALATAVSGRAAAFVKGVAGGG